MGDARKLPGDPHSKGPDPPMQAADRWGGSQILHRPFDCRLAGIAVVHRNQQAAGVSCRQTRKHMRRRGGRELPINRKTARP